MLWQHGMLLVQVSALVISGFQTKESCWISGVELAKTLKESLHMTILTTAKLLMYLQSMEFSEYQLGTGFKIHLIIVGIHNQFFRKGYFNEIAFSKFIYFYRVFGTK